MDLSRLPNRELVKQLVRAKPDDPLWRKFVSRFVSRIRLAVLHYDWAQREPERAYGHCHRGLGLLRQAQDRAPEDPRILYNFGMFYEALEMRGPAIQAWESYLKTDPASQWSEEAAYHLGQLSPQ